MAQNRSASPTRTLDLNALLLHVGECRGVAEESCPDALRVIPHIESRLIYADQMMQALLARKKANLTGTDLTVYDALQQEYARIVAELDTSARMVLDQAAALTENSPSPSAALKKFIAQFIQLGNDIKKMSDVIRQTKPPKDSWQVKNIYSFATALGGLYVNFSQNNLPTMGGMLRGEEFTASEGNCAGIVIEWANQSLTMGTPQYPISCTIPVLQSQLGQGDVKKTLNTNKQIAVSSINLIQLFENLKKDELYYVVIADDSADKSHALGFRKHESFIEIVDPNYGYFFFKDAKSAGTWLATLLHEYQAVNFPALTISHSPIPHEKKALPVNTYPNLDLLERATVARYTEAGATYLYRQYWQQLDYLIEMGSLLKLTHAFDTVIDSMRYMYANFDNVQREALLHYLQACVDGSFVKTPHDKAILITAFTNSDDAVLFSEKIKTNSAYKTKISSLMIQLKKIPPSQLDATDPTMQLVNEYRKQEETYLAVANEAAASKRSLELELEALKKSNAEPEARAALEKQIQEKADIVRLNTGMRVNLRKRNVDGKLLAARDGVLRENYGLKEARAELQEASTKIGKIYEQANTIIAALEKQLNEATTAQSTEGVILSAHDATLKNAGITPEVRQNVFLAESNLLNIVDKLEKQAKINRIKKTIQEVKDVLTAVVNNQTTQTLDAVTFQLETTLPVLRQQLLQMHTTDIKSSAKEIMPLFRTVSINTPDSAISSLLSLLEQNELAGKEPNADVSRIVKAQLVRLINIRSMIIQSVDPAAGKADLDDLSEQLAIQVQHLVPHAKNLSEITSDALRLGIARNLSYANKPKQLHEMIDTILQRLETEVNENDHRSLRLMQRQTREIYANYVKGKYDQEPNPAEYCVRSLFATVGLQNIADPIPMINANAVEKVVKKQFGLSSAPQPEVVPEVVTPQPSAVKASPPPRKDEPTEPTIQRPSTFARLFSAIGTALVAVVMRLAAAIGFDVGGAPATGAASAKASENIEDKPTVSETAGKSTASAKRSMRRPAAREKQKERAASATPTLFAKPKEKSTTEAQESNRSTHSPTSRRQGP